MKVLFIEKMNSYLEKEIKNLRADFPDTEFLTGPPSEDLVRTADVLFGSKIDSALIKEAESLKLIVVPIVGVDRLPFDVLRKRNVRVANSHGNALSVAERGLAMILAFFGRIVEYHNDLKNLIWHGFWVDKGLEDTWTSIIGKKVAVLGAGEIGSCLADMLKPFNCEIIGFKRKPVTSLPPNYSKMTTSLSEALIEGDIIVNLLPLTDSTKGLLSKEILLSIKDKFLLNLGRGEVIDEQGLYEALRTGVLLGAGIDTWYTYPAKGKAEGPPSRYPIHTLPNVILSPHTAGFTIQAAKLNMEQGIENLRRFLKRGELMYEVDIDSGY